MADNIELNVGTGGDDLAADEIAGVKHQRVKIQYGVDGSATDVSDTNPLPIDDAGGSLTVDGTVTANLGATDNAVLDQIEVNTSYGDSTGGGTEAAALRVTIASDSTGVISVDDNSGSLTVDNAGTFAVQADSVTPGTAAGNLGKAEDAAHTTGDVGVMSLVVRNDGGGTLAGADGDYTPLQVNASGALVVTGGGGGTEYTDDTSTHASGSSMGGLIMAAATPTDGSVDANDIGAIAMSTDRRMHTDAQIVGQDANLTVDLGATDNAVLDQIEVNTSYGDSVGGGTEAAALRVTIANNSTGVVSVDDNGGALTVDNAGTFATQVDGDALTALQLIDDIVHTDDTSTHATGTTKGAAIMAAATPTDGSVGANDMGVIAMSTDRRLHVDSQIVGQDADVAISDGGNSITVDGTVTANLGATDNAVLDQIEVNTSYGDNTGTGTESGALRVTIATDSTGLLSVDDNGGSLTVDGTVTANLSATDNAVLDQIETNTSYGDNTGGGTEAGSLRVTIANNSTGVVSVDDGGGALTVDGTVTANVAAGSNLVGDVGLSGARTSGGTTLYKNIDVDESEDQIKGTAGQVYWIHAMNLSSGARFLKFYNATAASVTVGTTVPDLTFPLATQGDTNGAGFTLSIPNGIAFGTAITIAATTGVADNDSGAPGANDVVVNLGYA